jgi:hypothetical protein
MAPRPRRTIGRRLASTPGRCHPSSIPTFHRERITNAGTFGSRETALHGQRLKQHTIGLEEVADGIWSIHFCRVLLGRVDERDYIIRG